MSFHGQPQSLTGGCTACTASYVEQFGTSYRVLDIHHQADCPAMARKVVVDAPCDWINSNQRLHRMQTAKLTAAWRQAGMDAAKDVPPCTDHVRILAHIWKPRRGRYDAGNLYPTAKAAIDGIVSAGVLVDDSNEYVTGPDMRHGGIGPARLVIEIVPVTGAVAW